MLISPDLVIAVKTGHLQRERTPWGPRTYEHGPAAALTRETWNRVGCPRHRPTLAPCNTGTGSTERSTQQYHTTTQPLNHTHRNSHIQDDWPVVWNVRSRRTCRSVSSQGTGPASRDGYMRPHDLSLYHCFFVPRGLSALRHQRHEHIHSTIPMHACFFATRPSPARSFVGKGREDQDHIVAPPRGCSRGARRAGSGRGEYTLEWEWERERRRRSRVQMQQRGERRVQ